MKGIDGDQHTFQRVPWQLLNLLTWITPPTGKTDNLQGPTCGQNRHLSRSELLWSYSGLHSHATPVYIPVILWSTAGLDQTPLDLPFDWPHTQPDMGSSCHSPVTYVPISCHLYSLVPSLFPAHIYFHLLIFHLSHLCLTLAVAEVCTPITYSFTTYLLY